MFRSPEARSRTRRRSNSAIPARPASPRRRSRALLAAIVAVTTASTVFAIQNAASAAPSSLFVSGVTFPFNGVWLESGDGGHYWDSSGNGLCRIDKDTAAPGGFSENLGTCDVQAKKPTQAAVGPKTPTAPTSSTPRTCRARAADRCG